jgi:hypothetical protein
MTRSSAHAEPTTIAAANAAASHHRADRSITSIRATIVKAMIKRSTTLLLQAVVVLFGITALALMLWEPHLEGRNAHATLFEIYFKDPFLAYAYTASIAFYAALYQAFKLFGYLGRDQAFSPRSVRALRTIKYCGMALVAMIGGAMAYLVIAVRGKDDIAGGIAVGLAMSVLSAVVATTAAVFERRLRNAIMDLRRYEAAEPTDVVR